MVKEQLKKVYLHLGHYFAEIGAPLFLTEWGRKASWCVLSLLIIMSFMSLVTAFSHWHQDYMITRAEPILIKENVAGAGDNAMQLIAQLPNEHLFGSNAIAQGAVPITSLQLRLIGIIQSESEGASRIIISAAGQGGKVYAVGDSLPAGIRVHAIVDDGVILENGEHLEKLPLQRRHLSFQGLPKSLLEQREEL